MAAFWVDERGRVVGTATDDETAQLVVFEIESGEMARHRC